MEVGRLLGKFAYEVEQLSPREFAEWLALIKIRADEERKAYEKAQSRTSRSYRR